MNTDLLNDHLNFLIEDSNFIFMDNTIELGTMNSDQDMPQYVTLEEIEYNKPMEHGYSIDIDFPQVQDFLEIHSLKTCQIENETNGKSNNISEPSAGKRIKYLCEYPKCMKHFKDNYHLKVHQRKHTGEKPFTCEYPECNRKFSQKNNLKAHQRIHSGEKPYECKNCYNKFRQLANLKAHHKRCQEVFFG